MSNKNIYITQNFIDETEIDDVPILLMAEFGFDHDDNEQFIITNEDKTYHESSIVNIDTLINSLKTLKIDGSTHVAVDWHCDHLSYELYGYHVNFAEDNEIEDYQNRQKINEEKTKLRLELQHQLRQLNNEL
jgi:hypothetical protein